MSNPAISSGDILTWLLFVGAGVPGWYAWRETRLLGDRLTRWNRRVQRAAFVGLVFLGSFGIVAYALWKLGAPLAMGVGERKRMAEMAWMPPLMIAWAAWTYGLLRYNTRKGERHEKPS